MSSSKQLELTRAELQIAWLDTTPRCGILWDALFDKYPKLCTAFMLDCADFIGKFYDSLKIGSFNATHL